MAAYAASLRATGNPDQAALAHTLEDELAAHGRCRRCGRYLTDPASIERGYGPDCAALRQEALDAGCFA